MAWANGEGGKEKWLERMKHFAAELLLCGFSYKAEYNIYTDELVVIEVADDENAYVNFTAEYKKNGTLFRADIQGDGE